MRLGPGADKTWQALYARLAPCRATMAHPLFAAGLAKLGIGPEGVPDLGEVNRRLGQATGWKGVEVSGLEGPVDFFAALARREFPVGAFIRSEDDLNYTPAPDVFHDLYGHLPLLADASYAKFAETFGRAASLYAGDPARLRQFERVFWFGVEFPLVETPGGLRIFGGGILSSYGESNYALSSQPELRRFDVSEMRRREFKIDEMQSTLYVLQSPEELYGSLDELVRLVAAPAGGTELPVT